jgi:hypothetical protein
MAPQVRQEVRQTERQTIQRPPAVGRVFGLQVIGQLTDGDLVGPRIDHAPLDGRPFALLEQPPRFLLLLGATRLEAEHAEGVAVFHPDDGRLLQRAIGAAVGRSIEASHVFLPYAWSVRWRA